MLVGDPDQADAGLLQLFAGLNPERIMGAAFSNGMARYALEKAVAYAKERTVWRGNPIGTHQGIAHPLAKIKIEQAFVRGAAAGERDCLAIVNAIIALARGLGVETTAEGVETEAQAAAMRALGCNQLQGYRFGRPAPAADLRAAAAGDAADDVRNIA